MAINTTVSDSCGACQREGLETGVPYRVDVDTDGDFSVMALTGRVTPTPVVPEVVLNLQ